MELEKRFWVIPAEILNLQSERHRNIWSTAHQNCIRISKKGPKFYGRDFQIDLYSLYFQGQGFIFNEPFAIVSQENIKFEPAWE